MTLTVEIPEELFREGTKCAEREGKTFDEWLGEWMEANIAADIDAIQSD